MTTAARFFMGASQELPPGTMRVDERVRHMTLRLDDVDLQELDLIKLDLEGAELGALAGARVTIHRCKPAVIVEVSKLASRYGYAAGDLYDYMHNMGYKRERKTGLDELWLHT